jgi:uncharacterized protein (DUF2147 family)
MKMMKKLILSMALALTMGVAQAQNILGKWATEAGDAQVEIYQQGDKYNGKIVWLKQGPETTDKHNPDAKLQSRKLMGVNILSNLVKKKDKWEGGSIYNPKNGKTYKCKIWVEKGHLMVRGYLGPFYETQTWTKK